MLLCTGDRDVGSGLESKNTKIYTLGAKQITIYTDHKPLVSMAAKETTEIENPCLQNFFAKICHLNYKILFLKGSENTAADALSRMQSNQTDGPVTQGYIPLKE